VQRIEADLRQGQLTSRARDFGHCEGGDASRRIYLDAEGRPEKYVRQRFREGWSLTFEHYYAADGRLRFVSIHGGSTAGATLSHRVYLDAGGARLREEHRPSTKARGAFPETWPEEDLVVEDPRSAFSAAPGCGPSAP
jgi:hypothetical protein